MAKSGRKRSGQLLDKINESVNLPSGILSGMVHIELNSNNELIIDGRHSVIEYSDNLIRVNTNKGIVKIIGINLEIVTMCDSCLEICGTFKCFEFED